MKLLDGGMAYKQFLQIMGCRDCRSSEGAIWEKPDADGAMVVLTVDPCEKHQRMLDTQGWVKR